MDQALNEKDFLNNKMLAQPPCVILQTEELGWCSASQRDRF